MRRGSWSSRRSLRVGATLAVGLAGLAGLGGCGSPPPVDTRLDDVLAGQARASRKLDAVSASQDALTERMADANAETLLRLEDLETRLTQIENQIFDVLGRLGDSSIRAGRRPTAPDPTLENARAQYEAAYHEVTIGNLSEAIQRFETFLRRHPAHELADNAIYWIGECYYAEGDFNRAVEAFVRLMDTYPSADKVPAARLKLGFSFIELDDLDAARRYLESVISTYPDSEEAVLARDRLSLLDRSGGAPEADPTGAGSD